ncbi:asparagine synthase (glutamine-hydrolyzing) [Leptospira sp. GIMC2001]|uniref:asparagine synthase (glutamine-hydrolyzing) n=1 Tax=Leptospira sp. GIMC2001 TaxID=1513297 RepID=UPI00234B9588|nr:asparagine synthase (glutamine-hydrolyzing) [Leptospira sp. GIMC2001]WCL50834.1 asparagine synthase (glutamine-hydrolyzing) [Leptospira sp. GIMC2001]
MCGIGGIFNKDKGNIPDHDTLLGMAAIQYHRGPDGFGVNIFDDSGVGFCHTRLSIIDLESNRARQPFVSDNKELMLAHNGEFYDYQRIRARLTSKGYKFRTKSDSEILLHLYKEYGFEKSLEHLRGEFAFSLYDKSTDSLYLTRDRFGIKPQYWALTKSGDLVFGSEIKVILAHPDIERKLSESGVFHQLIQVMVPGSTTFEGINQVLPGHYLKVKRRSGKLTIQEIKYWDIDFPTLEERMTDRTEKYWVDAVRDQLLQAVELRLNADVPVGCYLSGGIDSCSILGLASAIRQDSVKAFTIGFDNDAYDESKIATRMAKSVGAEQDILMLDANQLYDHFIETHWHTERTIYNTLGVAKLLMSRHVNASGYKVVMTGEGSDELFAGYPSFRKDFFRYGLDDLPAKEKKEWESMLNQTNKLFRGAMLSLNDFNHPALTAKVGFMPACIENWVSLTPNARKLLNSDVAKHLKNYDPGNAIASKLDSNQLSNRHALDKAQYVWIKTMLEGQILTWGGDRVDMANSMEARPPFLDHHLAELAVQIPPNLRIKGKTEKYVLREAMRGVLPDELYKREKFAFMAPPAHTDLSKLNALDNLKSEYLTADRIKDLGLLDYKSIESLWSSYTDKATPVGELVQQDAILNHAVGVQILHDQFVKTDIPKKAAQLVRKKVANKKSGTYAN